MNLMVDPELQPNIQSGEHVLWTGRPNRTVSVLRVLPIMFFGLLFMLFPLGMMFFMTAFGFEALMCFSGIIGFLGLFVVIGGIVCFGPVIYTYLSAKVTNYALTDRRLITKSGVIGTDFQFTEFDKVQSVDVVVGFWDKSHGTGSINVTLPGVVYAGRNNIRGASHLLANIPNPYDVQRLLNDAIKTYNESRTGPAARTPRSSPRHPELIEQDREGKFCRYCGAPIPGDSQFCAKCGKRL